MDKIIKSLVLISFCVPALADNLYATSTQTRRNLHIPSPYVLTPERLRQIRQELLYPFYDTSYGYDNTGEFQKHITNNSPQLTKHLNIFLPFFGSVYNYTRVSLHGFLGFSDGPKQWPTYPLKFPILEYPKQSDPSFIGPFYSECKIGELAEDEFDKRKPGVYFRVQYSLRARTDQLGVEIRERLKWDIREGIVGSEWFEPHHAIIVTWKNITFSGGTINARKTTNTFQVIIGTDGSRTYAIFNYKHIGWTTHVAAGGTSDDGTGGTPAFIGFNAGNGVHSYEYSPYSQSTKFLKILSSGNINGFPGRHIFRIDEKIMAGQCIPQLYQRTPHKQMLSFAPESGNMLGGTIVNVTGPCFDRTKKVICRFNNIKVTGAVINANRAMCIMPRVYAAGYIDLFVEVEGSDEFWKGKFFVETPLTAPESVSFPDSEYLEIDPQKLKIFWDYKNLTVNKDVPVSITLWGYRENTTNPEIFYMETLANGIPNTGQYEINPDDLQRKERNWSGSLEIGLVTVNITNPSSALGIAFAPILWSRPILLDWYMKPRWEQRYGQIWSERICENWIAQDRLLKDYTADLLICPCTFEQAIADKGRFLPDPNCDKDGKFMNCNPHYYARHCVTSALPGRSGGGQQCCYDVIHGNLMMTTEHKAGGRPGRSREYGLSPWNETLKVPSLSHYLHDIAPFYPCCMWLPDKNWWCMKFRFEYRVSQNCVGYQPPALASVFGDPHIFTFDGVPYTFNGKGEFVLVRSNTDRLKLDIQARFEQPSGNHGREIRATVLTAIAVKENQSAVVEIRIRPRDEQWRYKLDVIVDQQKVLFDRYPQKIQTFPGVLVYTPTVIQNQSQVIAMFESGVGVEVIENKGHMTARVYMPNKFMKQTRGLFGNWSGIAEDDFVLPDGSLGPIANTNNLQMMHDQFAQHWLIESKETEEKGYSLFHHENGKNSSGYNDRLFRPVFYLEPSQIIPNNLTLKPEDVEDFCGNSYQCKYDYSMTLSRDYAHSSKYYTVDHIRLRDTVLKPIISCGPLMAPINGRTSSIGKYTPGTHVDFECDPNFILVGSRRRVCQANGEWTAAAGVWRVSINNELARCIHENDYYFHEFLCKHLSSENMPKLRLICKLMSRSHYFNGEIGL